MYRFNDMGILLGPTKQDTKKETFSPASSFLELIEYDEKARTMDITFKNGSKTRYLQIYPSTFQSFKQSPTHSAFYARAIKGNMISTKIIDNNIGTQKSTALKAVKREEPLDRGIKQQRAEHDRIWGTVERAINAATVAS